MLINFEFPINILDSKICAISSLECSLHVQYILWNKPSLFVVIYLIIVELDDIFTLIFLGCFSGIWTIIWLPQCQWNNLER